MANLTYAQSHTLAILNDGGRLYLFDNGSTALETIHNDSYKFRNTTFKVLKELGYIQYKYTPALGTQVWGISDLGKVNL